MKKKALALLAVAVMVIAGIAVVNADKPVRNSPKPGTDFNGPHFTLNIIGRKNIGNGDYDNFERHTIFVPLDGDTRITYELGNEFGVIDGNGLDGECIFQMPHGEGKQFNVYVVSLGKPGDGTDVEYPDEWIYDEETNTWYYLVGTFHIKGHGKKPEWQDVTEAFWVEYWFDPTDGDPYLLWEGWLWQVPLELFEETGYFWDLKGCDKHIQVRFYPV